MPTKQDYINQGYTEQQIQDATVNKNLQNIGNTLGQSYDTATGQFQAPTPTPQISNSSAQEVVNATSQAQSPTPQVQSPTVTEKPVSTQKENTQVVDYNVGKGREQDIINNLNADAKSDVNVQSSLKAGDYNTFKQRYGYDTADETKKSILDAYFQANQPKDQAGIFQNLKTGVGIKNQNLINTPEYNTAKAKYDLYSKFNGMSSEQLLTELKNNNIGSEMDKELMLNPQYQQAKQKYNQYSTTKAINDKNSALLNAMEGKKTQYTDYSSNLNDKIVGNMTASGKTESDLVSYRDYLAKNSPDLVEKVSLMNSQNKILREKIDARDQMVKTVLADHPGITKGAAIALAARLNEPLNEEIKSMSYTLENLASDIKYQTDIAQRDYDYLVKRDAEERQIAQQIAQEERQFTRQKELDQINFQQQKDFAEIQNKYQESRDIQNYKQDLQKLGITDAMQINRDNLNFEQQKQLADIQNKYQNSRDVQNYNQAINTLKYQYENAPENVAKNLENAKSNGLLSIIGNGKVTGYGGDYDGNKGLDVDGKKGDPVYGFNGKVVSIIDANYASSPYGNSVVIEDNQGNQIRLSHLDSINVKPGQSISENDVIGALGNTGNVIPGKGGDGSHLDIRVKKAGAQSEMPSKQVEEFLRGYSKQAVGKTELSSLGQFMKDNQETGVGYSNEDVKRFDAKIDRFVQAGDEEGMAKAYRNMLMQDKDFKKDFDDTQKFVRALDTVQNLVNEYEKAGKSTNAAKAFAEKIARSLGMTTDQALAQLQTQMGFTLANYIKSISGTAASDAEVQRLMGNMAQIGNVKDLNTTILKQVKENGLNGLKSMIDTRMYGMPEDLKPKIFGDIYTGKEQSKTEVSGTPKYQDFYN